jgi:nucleoside-diphosphate-sugar epimerase
MHKVYLAKQHNTPFTIMGSGKPLRQFIFSKDLAALMIWVSAGRGHLGLSVSGVGICI